MRYAGRPITKCIASIVVSHAASPIVKDGNMMWNETVKANCSRDSSNADSSKRLSYGYTCRCRREESAPLY